MQYSKVGRAQTRGMRTTRDALFNIAILLSNSDRRQTVWRNTRQHDHSINTWEWMKDLATYLSSSHATDAERLNVTLQNSRGLPCGSPIVTTQTVTVQWTVLQAYL